MGRDKVWQIIGANNLSAKEPMNVKNQTVFEGDNLDILRGLDSETIDLIYFDPPRKVRHAERSRRQDSEGI